MNNIEDPDSHEPLLLAYLPSTAFFTPQEDLTQFATEPCFLETALVTVPTGDRATSVSDCDPTIRVLYDQGSQQTIIKSSALARIPHTIKPVQNMSIRGVNGGPTQEITHVALISIAPRPGVHNTSTDFRYLLHAIIMQGEPWHITVPRIRPTKWKLLKNELADPAVIASDSSMPFEIILSNHDARTLMNHSASSTGFEGTTTTPSPFGLLVGGKVTYVPPAKQPGEEEDYYLATYFSQISHENTETERVISSIYTVGGPPIIESRKAGKKRAKKIKPYLESQWNSVQVPYIFAEEPLTCEASGITMLQENELYVTTQELKQLVESERLLVHGSAEETMLSSEEYLEKYMKSLTRVIDEPEAGCTTEERRKELASGNLRVVAPLPRNEKFTGKLSFNLGLVKRRMNSVLRILSRKDSVSDSYEKFVNDWIKKKVLIPIAREEMVDGECTILPHHGVIKISSTSTKLRVVIDGSAFEAFMKAINEFLTAGPNILPPIVSLLFNFRETQFFVLADIEKAFVQIALPYPDDHLIIFPWFDLSRGVPTNVSESLVFFRFARLPWGVISSPFVLHAVIRYLYRCEEKHSPTEKNMLKQLWDLTYVDDILSIGDTQEATAKMAALADQALARGKFNVTKYRSFPPELTQEVGKRVDKALECKWDSNRVLGIIYHPETDSISPGMENFEAFEYVKNLSKRQLAGIAARLFDPIGLYSPVAMEIKLIRQSMELEYPKLKWESPIPEKYREQAQAYITRTKSLKFHQLPRCVIPNVENEKEYFAFADSSGHGNGFTIYCATFGSSNTISSCNLVYAKSRVIPSAQRFDKNSKAEKERTPIKINRYELTAAKVLVDLAQEYFFLTKVVDPKCKYFSDSINTLRWIRNGPVHDTKFVNSRVLDIRRITTPDQWFHVPGHLNPADLASRGLTAEQLCKSALWFKGPTFLTDRARETWPDQPELGPVKEIATNFSLVKPKVVEIASYMSFVVRTKCKKTEEQKKRFVKKARGEDPEQTLCHRFNWTHSVLAMKGLIELQRKIRKFIKHPKKPRPDGKEPVPDATPPVCDPDAKYIFRNFEYASLCLIQEAQYLHCKNLLKGLQDPSEEWLMENPKVHELGLYLEAFNGGFLIFSRSRNFTQRDEDKRIEQLKKYRVSTRSLRTLRRNFRRDQRLKFAEKEQRETEASHYLDTLVYVPASSPVAWFIIAEAHFNTTGHGSDNSVLTKTREKYWIPGARKMCKGIRRGCLRCYRSFLKFYKTKQAPLPLTRLTGQRPYEAVGVDFTGPFRKITNDPEYTPSILVLVDPWTRIICLEATGDQTAEAFEDAFDHWRHTRSTEPSVIISDNAKAFKSISVKMKEKLQYAHIEWKFIVPRAPWMGGFYERLIGILKNHMAKEFYFFSFRSREKFRSCVAFLERCINERPLTFVSDERSQYEPITANQLLNPQASSSYAKTIGDMMYPIDLEGQTAQEMIEIHSRQEYFYARLLDRFRSLYIDSLRKWNRDTRFARGAGAPAGLINKGDWVVVKPLSLDLKGGSPMHRKLWPTARVTKVNIGSGNQIRSVEYDTYQHLPGGQTVTAHHGPHPIQYMAPLETAIRTKTKMTPRKRS